jgi:uncharacterized membrane protein
MTEEPTPTDAIPEEAIPDESAPEDISPESYASEAISSDDKLWALLTYVFSPLVPIIILLLEDKKERPFIQAHNAQSLVMGIINVLLAILLGWTVFLSCIPFIIWIVMVYWGFKAYQGEFVEIPVVSNFVRNQGWA